MCEPWQMTVATVIAINVELAKVIATVTAINVEVVVEVVTEMGMGTQMEIESLAAQRWKEKRRQMWRYRGKTSKSKSVEFMEVQNLANLIFYFKIQARVNFVLLQCAG